MIVVVKPSVKTVTVLPSLNEVVVNSPITALAEMNDVEFNNLAENDVLKYTAGKWQNSPIGADASYIHNQGLASSTWSITHNLGKYPNYTVIDSSGDEVEGDITYINTQQIVLTFSASFSGTAYLN